MKYQHADFYQRQVLAVLVKSLEDENNVDVSKFKSFMRGLNGVFVVQSTANQQQLYIK